MDLLVGPKRDKEATDVSFQSLHAHFDYLSVLNGINRIPLLSKCT